MYRVDSREFVSNNQGETATNSENVDGNVGRLEASGMLGSTVKSSCPTRSEAVENFKMLMLISMLRGRDRMLDSRHRWLDVLPCSSNPTCSSKSQKARTMNPMRVQYP